MASYALDNRVLETYMLMTLCPIKSNLGSSRQTRLREVFDGLGLGEASPFRKIPMLHFVRFVIVYDVPGEGYPTKRDHLQSPYLLMSADIAGDWEMCIQSMMTEIRPVIRSIFENCVGFPGAGDGLAFLNYLKQCQIDAAFAFGAYPQASVYEVRSALSLQKRYREFVLKTQEIAPERMQEEFRRFMSELENEEQ
jgi:hypothetical protein